MDLTLRMKFINFTELQDLSYQSVTLIPFKVQTFIY